MTTETWTRPSNDDLTGEEFDYLDSRMANANQRFYRASEHASETVELFVRREEADAFIAEVDADDPELAALLRVEAIDLR